MGALVSLPVAPFAAGVAARGPGAGSVALGFPRVFPSETAHVFVGVGSPHGAEKKDQTGHKMTGPPSSFPKNSQENK